MLEATVHEVLEKVAPEVAQNVVGIAFDTTGSTPCFIDEAGTPLALKEEFAENPNAMFVLWKDHTAIKEADEINALCRRWEVDYTAYEGGIYSSEWLWAKALHVLRADEAVRNAAYSIVEHCEWMPALLTGMTKPAEIVRSRCAQGHKAMWHTKWGGLPSEEFLSTLDPLLKGLRGRMFVDTETAEKPVGHLTEEWAQRLGLSTDVVVAGGAFDCHMGAVGAGIQADSWVRIIGTSTCDIVVAKPESVGDKLIPGICGQVDGSVVPGLIGFEAGQSAFGDIYAWFRRVLEFPMKAILGDKLTIEELDKACDKILPALTVEAEKIPIGESGVIAVDWMNGRRTPDADQTLKGAIAGITLGTTAPMIYRALVEATAFGSKAIMERMKSEGIRINGCIGIGGIALKSPFVMQVMSDVLGVPISVCESDQACALGASIFAAVAAGLYPSVEEAQKQMASGCAKEYTPIAENQAKYEALYNDYLALGRYCEGK